jgi:hypothetical protein
MIDVWAEDLLSLHDATRARPFLRNGQPVNIATLFRYVQRGIRGRSGERVRLEAVRTPGGLKTSRQAIGRFIERINSSNPSEQTPCEIEIAHVRAERSLESEGF